MNDVNYPAGYLDRNLDAVITRRSGDWVFDLSSTWDILSGGVERKAARLAGKISWGDINSSYPTVLCLDRALFRKDVAELRKRLQFNFPTLSAVAVKKAQEAWIPPQWRRQTFFAGYLDGPLGKSKALLRQFGVGVLRQAGKTHRIDAVLSANTDYWQDEAIRMGCQQLGIPFLTLCRENYLWPTEVTIVQLQYKLAGFHFHGAGTAVASEATRAALAATGSFEQRSIWLTGWPRFDAWKDAKTVDFASRDTVVLFSYADPMYLAPENFSDVLNCFVELAARYGETTRFVLKVKKKNEIEPLMVQFPKLRTPAITVVSDEPLPDLLGRSKVAIGYNSTTLLEALLSGAAVIVPAWSDSKRRLEDSGLNFARETDRQVAFFPESPDELIACASDVLTGKLLPIGSKEERYARFSQYSHVDETKSSSECVDEFLRHYIGRQQG